MTPPRSGRPRGTWLLWALLCANILPELVLQAADAGLIGTGRWRLAAYSYGALWRGLIRDWQPNFAAQPLTMFLTYGFLHDGLAHLAGNMAALAWLAPPSLRAAGPRGLAAIYATALLAGGLAFALLSPSIRPMIGASGAVYGLAAAWIYWDYSDRRRAGLPLAPTWAKLAFLAALNALSWWLLSGQLAWETHAGGAIGAWGCAWWLDRRKLEQQFHRISPSSSENDE